MSSNVSVHRYNPNHNTNMKTWDEVTGMITLFWFYDVRWLSGWLFDIDTAVSASDYMMAWCDHTDTIQTPYNYCANVTGVCWCAVAPYYFHLLWSIKSLTLSLSTILSSLWIGHNCPLLWQRELLKLVYCNNMQVITIDKIYISQLRMKNEEHL